MSLPLGTQLGNYEITALLGVGGMGEVYQARDARLGRAVAIKVLPEGFGEDRERLRRFEQEAKVLAALNHPHLLAIHELGSHDGMPFLVMELLEGETLRERLAHGALPVKEAIGLALQMGKGLAAAHAKGVTHRDLKPANIFLTRDGLLKILDFGLAKKTTFAHAGEETATLGFEGGTAAGLIVGSVGYMSPEQISGQPVDARSDIFAFGILFFEMLTGVRAFERDSVIETLSATLKEAPPPLKSPTGPVPSSLLHCVNRCLEKDPGQRFQRVEDLIQTMELALGELSSPGLTGAPPGRGHGRWAGRRGLVASGILGLLLLCGGLAWRLLHAPPGAGPTAHLPTVLPLPTRVLGSPEAAFLTDAIPDTLSTFLGSAAGLETKLPPSSGQVEKAHGDLARIAAASGVDYLVLSTVTVQGDRLALNVKLAEAATQKVRWAGQFQGTRSSYNELTQQAAEGVMRALSSSGARLTPASGSSEFGWTMGEGKHFRYRYGNLGQEADFLAAKHAFERAMELEPSQPLPPAQLAGLYLGGMNYSDDPVFPQQAEAWARKALALDPQCGDAWATLALVETFRSSLDLEKALDYALKAVRFAPEVSNAHMAISVVASSPGSVGFMMAGGHQALAREPLKLIGAFNLALGLATLGRPGEALPIVDRALAMEPGSKDQQQVRSFALIQLGRLAEAEAILDRIRPSDPTSHDPQTESWRQISLTLAVAKGDMGTVRSLAHGMLKHYLEESQDSQTVACTVLWICPSLVQCGMTEEALALMQRSVDLHAPPPLDKLELDPELRKLKGEPRFQKILQASRKGAAIIVRRFDEAQARGELPRYLEEPLAELRQLVNHPGGTDPKNK